MENEQTGPAAFHAGQMTGFARGRPLLAALALSGAALLSCAPLLARNAGPAVPSTAAVSITVHEGTSLAFALSADRKKIALDLQGLLFVMPASGGRAVAITDELFDARQPTWSADGKSIAFQSNRDGHWRIWVVGEHGEQPHALSTGWNDEREPSWSPDGARIAFTSDRSGKFDVWQITLATGELKQLTHGPGGNSRPSWSPDGRSIAFVSDRTDQPGLYTVDETGAEHKVAGIGFAGMGMTVPMGTPSWTPDGKHVLFAEISSGSARLVLDGSVVASGEDYHPFRAQWLSNDELLYSADGKIKRRSLSKGQQGTIDFTATLRVRTPQYQRRRYNFDSSEPQHVHGIQRTAISPDGTRVAFTALGDLWLMPIGGEPKRLTDGRPHVVVDPAWSPSGDQLVYSSDAAGSLDLWVYDLKSSHSRRVTNAPGAEMRPAWSPDGKRIAYVDASGAYSEAVHVLDLKSDKDQTLKEAGSSPGYPNWSPDGRLLMVSQLENYSTSQSYIDGGTNQILIVPVDGGPGRNINVLKGHSVGNRSGDGPVWSPDGRHIAFQMDSSLWLSDVSAEGVPQGAPRKLSDEIATGLSWTGDSRRLLVQSGGALKLVAADTGSSQVVALPLTWRAAKPTGRVTIFAGRLVDGIHATARENVDIVIDANRIVSITAHGSQAPEGRVIDASGLTVMPGMMDMHEHLIKEYGSSFGRLLLSYGVTTVRSPGNVPGDVLEEKEAIDAGQRPGPRMFVTGYILDGERTVWEMGTPVRTPAEADRQLTLASELGYDMIKTYMHTAEPMRQHIVEGAHRLGLPVSSHDIYPAALWGSDSVEHLDGNGCGRGYASKSSQLNTLYDDVVQILARSGMSVTPTVSLFTPPAEFAKSDPDKPSDPREALQPVWVRGQPLFTFGGLPGGDLQLQHIRGSILKLYKAGVKVVVGTDSPFTPVGLNTHNELEQEVRAGLTAFEALRTATVLPAEVLGVAKDLGSVEPGKLADLVFVEGDPLQDIRAARRVRQVMKNGQLYTLDELVRQPGTHEGSAGGAHE